MKERECECFWPWARFSRFCTVLTPTHTHTSVGLLNAEQSTPDRTDWSGKPSLPGLTRISTAHTRGDHVANWLPSFSPLCHRWCSNREVVQGRLVLGVVTAYLHASLEVGKVHKSPIFFLILPFLVMAANSADGEGMVRSIVMAL